MGQLPDGVYPAPAHGWTCFHCGENFANPNLARAHFGETPRARPACVLIQERGMLYELREAQRERDEAMARARRAKDEAEMYEGQLAEYQRVAHCSSVGEFRMHLDSVEGRALTSELLVEFALKCGVVDPSPITGLFFADREALFAALEKTLPTPETPSPSNGSTPAIGDQA